MDLVFAVMAGVAIGIFITTFMMTRNTIGRLKIDNSYSEEEPYLFLELSKDMTFVNRQSYVLMKVDRVNYMPRK